MPRVGPGVEGALQVRDSGNWVGVYVGGKRVVCLEGRQAGIRCLIRNGDGLR